MHGRAMGILVAVALAIVGLADSTRAAEITGGYRLVGLPADTPSIGSFVQIDEGGNVGTFFNVSDGDYAINRVYDPDYSGRVLEVILRKSGSDANLLPEFLRTYRTASIVDYNASGGVIGDYNGPNNGPFYYNVETREHFNLKNLPGAVQLPQAFRINDLGQIVGAVDGKAILYASPEAVPVELMKLVASGDGWNLGGATGINNRGEIAGYGSRADTSDSFYKLVPQAVPEPSSIVVFGSVGLLGAWLSAKGRGKRRTSPAASKYFPRISSGVY